MIKRGILLMVVLVGSAMPMAGEAAPTPRVRDGASGKGGAASKKKSIAPVTATDKVKAAALFKAGQALYNAGRFGEAIAAFSKAQVLAPHPFSLFNIARCHENLGRPRAALRFYREALAATSDPKLTKDLQSRIARLQRFPSKIFVTSDPPGATVTLDGAAAPRAKRTPLVVTLPAGEHVLLFRKEGHILVVRRVELRAGREVTVRVSLPRRRPKPVPCPAPLPIPPCPRCRDARLMTFTGLHLHVALNGGFAIAKDLGAVAGPGVQVSATIDRFRVGVHFQYLPVNPSSLAKLAGTQERSSFMQGQAEGGYTFPFGRFHLYATVGVGLYLNRLITPGTDTKPDETKETGGVIWSLGGGIEVMVFSWISLGVGLRLGLMHGDLLDVKKESALQSGDPPVVKPMNVPGPFPIGTLWGAVNFHL